MVALGILAKVMWTSQDGMMGRDDRRSRCFERYTEAESTGEATGVMAMATTGVAMTTGRCCMDASGKAYWELGLRCECIGTVHDAGGHRVTHTRRRGALT